MSQLHAAVASDRLPWLEDDVPEPAPRAAPAPVAVANGRAMLPWALLAILVVAALSYWLGQNSSKTGQADAPRWSGTTIPLPEAQTANPQPQVELTPAPEVRPVPAPAVALPQADKRGDRERASTNRERTSRSAAQKSGNNLATAAAEQAAKALSEDKPAAQQASPEQAVATPEVSPTKPAAQPVAKPAAKPAAKSKPAKLWSARQPAGAAGRLVQIGAFGSRQQAKLGWRRMTRAYPAVGRLPAVVVPARNSRGRTFYRFQIGTTSQAHSEVLCQRMERIRYSCAVVGLPWKAKVER